jgi:trehalose-6-phosphate synthase
MDEKITRTDSVSKLGARIVVVSNRLPITIEDRDFVEEDENSEKWDFKMSSGGLVAGLEGVKKKMHFLWAGWTGKWVPGKIWLMTSREN